MTFVLELINFLVLIWILNRLLYRPLMNVIAQRKAAIQKTLSDAEAVRGKAQALQAQYEHRLADWDQERDKAREQLRDDVAGERIRLLDNVRTELVQEREKAAALEQRQMKEFMQQAEATAIEHGRTFASRLLSRFSGPDLERSIVDMVIDDLPHLPEEQKQAIRLEASAAGFSMTVTSAYPLDQAQRDALCRACRTLVGREVRCDFGEDRTLMCGVRMSVGSWVLRANVQDELSFFAGSVHHA